MAGILATIFDNVTAPQSIIFTAPCRAHHMLPTQVPKWGGGGGRGETVHHPLLSLSTRVWVRACFYLRGLPPVHTYTHVLPKQSSYAVGWVSELLSLDLTLFRPAGERGGNSGRMDWKLMTFLNKQAKATRLGDFL